MKSSHGFWNLLARDDQRDLLARGRDKKFPPGATMCLQGDPATHVFVLLDGWVKILEGARRALGRWPLR
jgi:CRP-like cAMP-binding protein